MSRKGRGSGSVPPCLHLTWVFPAPPPGRSEPRAGPARAALTCPSRWRLRLPGGVAAGLEEETSQQLPCMTGRELTQVTTGQSRAARRVLPSFLPTGQRGRPGQACAGEAARRSLARSGDPARPLHLLAGFCQNQMRAEVCQLPPRRAGRSGPALRPRPPRTFLGNILNFLKGRR